MKRLHAELVYQTSSQRFYRLSEKILKFKKSGKIVEVSIDEDLVDVKPEYAKSFREQMQSGYSIICISDAHSHIERLTFGAVQLGDTYYRTHRVLCGYWTFKIHGGDSSRVYPDSVYIRFLAGINGFYFNNRQMVNKED